MTREIVDAVFTVAWGAATDPGRVRTSNEDSFLAAPPVFLVADGMGGHSRGEVASRLTVSVFEQLAGRPWLGPRQLYEAVHAAATLVASLGEGLAAPGTTLTGVGLSEQDGRPYWLAFNIGDSRAYLLRGQRLEQLTVDHSRAQECLDAGEIVDEAFQHVITRALGGGSRQPPVADHWLVPAQPGDRILVCTDGLTTELSQPAIAGTLLGESDPQAAARMLVDSAVEAGGRDNVTVVVVDAVDVSARLTLDGVDDDTVTEADWGELEHDTVIAPMEGGQR